MKWLKFQNDILKKLCDLPDDPSQIKTSENTKCLAKPCNKAVDLEIISDFQKEESMVVLQPEILVKLEVQILKKGTTMIFTIRSRSFYLKRIILPNSKAFLPFTKKIIVLLMKIQNK